MVSILMVAALLLGSCGPRGDTTTPTPAPTPTPVLTPTPKPTPAALMEKPKCGRVINFVHPTDLKNFGFPVGGIQSVGGICYEQLLRGDWSKGAAGTGETDLAALPLAISLTSGGGILI